MGERFFFYWLTRGHNCSKTVGEVSYPPIAWPMTPEPLETATFGHAQPRGEAISGYGTNNVAGEGPTPVTTTPVSSLAGLETPTLGQESSNKKCGCIVCHGIGIIDSELKGKPGRLRCRFASCNRLFEGYGTRYVLPMHERTHYQRGPAKPRPPFSCLVEDCRFSSKRWSDFIRHTSTKHCNDPTKFACSVFGCKHNGEGNGFTRKDKLLDHFKSMHKGQKMQGKAVRALKPAPASSYAEASGSSSMSA